MCDGFFKGYAIGEKVLESIGQYSDTSDQLVNEAYLSNEYEFSCKKKVL